MSTTTNAAVATAIAGTMKETMGAEIVTKTLDTLNQTSKGNKNKSSGNAMPAGYDFNKSVLSAAYGTAGVIANVKI